MQGGTYARALDAGFTDKQATFFSHFGIDLKNETADRLKQELDEFVGAKTVRNFIARTLIKAGHKLAKEKE